MEDDSAMLRRLACVARHQAHFYPGEKQIFCIWCGAGLVWLKETTKDAFASEFPAGKWSIRDRGGKYTQFNNAPPDWLQK